MSMKQKDIRRLIFVVTGEPETFEYQAQGKNGPYTGKVFKVNVHIAQIDNGYEPGVFELVHFGFNPPDIQTGDKYEADLDVGSYNNNPQVTIVKDRQKHTPVYLKLQARIPPKKQKQATLEDTFAEPAKVEKTGPPADRPAPDTVKAQLSMKDMEKAQGEIDTEKAKKLDKINWLPLDQNQPAANIVETTPAVVDKTEDEIEQEIYEEMANEPAIPISATAIVETVEPEVNPQAHEEKSAYGEMVPSAKEFEKGIPSKKLSAQEQRDLEDVKASFAKAEKAKVPSDPSLKGQIKELWNLVLEGDETMGHKYRPPIGIYRASSSSTLEDCMRRAYLDRRWEDVFKDFPETLELIKSNYQPKIGEAFGPAAMGTGVHEYVQSRLQFTREGHKGVGKNAHMVLGMEEEVFLERGNIKMVGHYDILVRYDGNKYVHDIKSYNSKWGSQFNDKEGHMTQLALMQAGLGGIDGVLWYIGRNGGESDPYIHPWDEDAEVRVDKVFKKFEELYKFEMAVKTPERLPMEFRRKGASLKSNPKKQAYEFPCRRLTSSPPYKCEFWEVCWNKGKPEE